MKNQKKNVLLRKFFSNRSAVGGNDLDSNEPSESQSMRSSVSLEIRSTGHEVSLDTSITRISEKSDTNHSSEPYHINSVLSKSDTHDKSTKKGHLSPVTSSLESKLKSKYSNFKGKDTSIKSSSALKYKISSPTLITSTQNATIERLKHIGGIEEEGDSQATIDSLATTLHIMSLDAGQLHDGQNSNSVFEDSVIKPNSPISSLINIGPDTLGSISVPDSSTSSIHTLQPSDTVLSSHEIMPDHSNSNFDVGNLQEGPFTTTVPQFTCEEEEMHRKVKEITTDDLSQPEDMIQVLAKSLFDGSCQSVSHYDAASWIGDSGTERGLVRKAYMDNFNWENLSVLGAIRSLCDKLYMKAESQQLDRIIDAFSVRWCACNPNHGFKTVSVIYTLAYSILLLNTDHHSEEYSSRKKMPRQQYAQSTLQAMSALAISDQETLINDVTNSPQKFNLIRGRSTRSSSYKRSTVSTENGIPGENSVLVNCTANLEGKEWEQVISSLLKSVYTSVDLTPLSLARPEKELRPFNSRSSTNRKSTFELGAYHSGEGFPRRNSWIGPTDSWSEHDYSDAITNNSYNSTGKRRFVLQSSNGKPISSHSSIYTTAGNIQVPRDPTVGFAGALWSTIIREEQEKTTLLDINKSVCQETGESDKLSEEISRISSQSRNGGDICNFQPNHKSELSHSNMTGDNRDLKTSISIYSNSKESSGYSKFNDVRREEELMLNGAPWAKEGLLKFQAFFDKDSSSKRYMKKGWMTVFVVVQHGYLKMFQFETQAPTRKKATLFSSFSKNRTRNKGKLETPENSISDPAIMNKNVGSGNWLENAVLIDQISLCHSLSQIIHITEDGTDLLGVLPASSVKMSKKTNLASHNGDNVQWSLKISNGGVLAFLAGTREIADEYVYTCNYWASRVSREPLVEAVSSSEFGWKKPLDLIFHQVNSKSSTKSTKNENQRVSHKLRSNSISLGAPLIPQCSNPNDSPGIANTLAKDLLRKKSTPNLSLKKGTGKQARLNILQTANFHVKSHGADSSIGSFGSSFLNGSNTPHTLNSFHSDSVKGILNISSAATASASATAAATSLLGLNVNSLPHPLHKDPVQNGFKTVTTKHAEGGTIVVHNGRKFFIASGSYDTLLLNNSMIQIKEWRPPVPSALHSVLDEVNQLETLNNYTLTVNETLEEHTSLRAQMMTVFHAHLLVTPRVTANWEKRSDYLLREAVKYGIYISTLTYAIQDRKKLELTSDGA